MAIKCLSAFKPANCMACLPLPAPISKKVVCLRSVIEKCFVCLGLGQFLVHVKIWRQINGQNDGLVCHDES